MGQQLSSQNCSLGRELQSQTTDDHDTQQPQPEKHSHLIVPWRFEEGWVMCESGFSASSHTGDAGGINAT